MSCIDFFEDMVIFHVVIFLSVMDRYNPPPPFPIGVKNTPSKLRLKKPETDFEGKNFSKIFFYKRAILIKYCNKPVKKLRLCHLTIVYILVIIRI